MTDSSETRLERLEERPQLRRGSMGARHLVFFVVGAAAPLTILVGFAPLGLGVAGAALPVAYLIPGLVYLLFAVGFTAMSRHFNGAGAFYAYISEGLSPIIGAGAALLAYLGYLGGQIGFVLACGIFTAATLDSFFGLSPSVYVCALAISLTIGVVGYRRVDLGAKVLMVLMTLELGILAIFCVAVLAQGGQEGIELSSFSPGVFLSTAVASAFALTFTSFVGFEQTTIYSEECKDPRRTISRATYIAVGVLTLVYTFCSWVIVQAIGVGKMADVLSGDPSSLIFALNSEFAGTFMTEIMRVLIVTSFFAGCIALHNACTRYLFAMGRTRILPSPLARVSATTQTPSVAGITQTLIVTAVIALFSLTSADPYLEVVVWTNTPTIIAVLTLQVLTSVAIVRYFLANARGESIWSRLIAPAASVIVLGVAGVYLAANMGDLTGLGTTGNLIINIPIILGFVLGVARGYALRHKQTKHRMVGRGLH